MQISILSVICYLSETALYRHKEFADTFVYQVLTQESKIYPDKSLWEAYLHKCSNSV